MKIEEIAAKGFKNVNLSGINKDEMQRCDGRTTTDPTASGMEPQCNERVQRDKRQAEGTAGGWGMATASN